MVWEHKGTIAEVLYETQWVVTAYNLLSGDIITSKNVNGSSFTLDLPSADPIRVTVEPRRFDIWRASTEVSLSQRVYPTDPENNPFYYRCITAGTTSASEPTWLVSPSAVINDGSAVWTIVERIILPTSKAPIIPTVKA